MDPIHFRSNEADVRAFAELTKAAPLQPKLKFIHEMMRRRYGFIDRVAVAIFHADTGKLRAFVSSNDMEDPLARHEFPLDQALSLMELIVKGPRVVNDLSVFEHGVHEHTRKIREHGYKASYTTSIHVESAFRGFVFVNSYQMNCFTAEVVRDLDLYCQIISAVVFQDLNRIQTLNSALKTLKVVAYSSSASDLLQPERMSQITQLILEDLVASKKLSMSDEMIERLTQFAALHDVGKFSVPESILMKREGFTIQEFTIMSAHAEAGLKMVDAVISNFGFESIPGIEMLRNIVLLHHERIDGSGYPFKRTGENIPIETRIVAVADVYNGLTSNRPHRTKYESDEAFRIIERLAGPLDRDCVAALLRCKEKLQTL